MNRHALSLHESLPHKLDQQVLPPKQAFDDDQDARFSKHSSFCQNHLPHARVEDPFSCDILGSDSVIIHS